MVDKREIPFGRPWIEDRDKAKVMEVLDGHILTHGPNCHEFEDKFAKFTGSYAVTTSSCMASLHLSTLHFGFKEGDEVLVPAQTHVATVHAVELTGAKPVFVDCELKTGNMDIEKIAQAVTQKTKGIVIVHYAGIPVEMDKVMEIADKHNLIVIEDCALAVGGFYKGKHVGTWGHTGCYSFYPVKHITTGEGGMLISKDEDTVKKIANFRAFNYDRDRTKSTAPGVYDVIGVGMNYRMSELQAALGVVQMDKVDEILARRKENFEALKKGLSNLDFVSVLDSDNPDVQSSYYCLIAVMSDELGEKRPEVIARFKDMGVGTSVYYPQPVARMAYYQGKYGYNPDSCKNAAKISDHALALPVGPHLSTEDMEYIADCFKKIAGDLL